MEYINWAIDNADTIGGYMLIAFNVVSGTSFGCSVITAVTETRNTKWYKAIEAGAILFNKAKQLYNEQQKLQEAKK